MNLLLLPLAFLGTLAQAAPQPAKAVSGAPTAEAAAERATITEPRIRLMPPGAPNTGAFFTVANAGPDTALVSASVPAGLCAKVELHTHVEVDGAMRMRQVDRIPLPAGGAVALKPGGLHVMLIGLSRPLQESEVVPITLRFEDGTTQTVAAPVARIQPQAGMKHP